MASGDLQYEDKEDSKENKDRIILYVQEVVTHFLWQVTISIGSLLLGHIVEMNNEHSPSPVLTSN